MMTERENWLKTVEFGHPEWIPASAGFSLRTWHTHRERLEEIALRHPRLIRGYPPRTDWDEYPVVYREGEYFRDTWGCLWYNTLAGLEGQVVEHPLESWDAFATWQPPDWRTLGERGPQDWDAFRRALGEARRRGDVVGGDGGRLFDRLYFLRGFENLMMDFATDDPHLPKLIERFWAYVKDWNRPSLEFGVDVMNYHTDIGTQHGLMISPAHFRRYLKPMFKDLFQACRKAGAHVLLSSDGRILEIIDDLIECGISVHDPQLRANGLDAIERVYKGRLCISLDLDRQMFAFSTPADIRAMVRESVRRLRLPEGGLMVNGAVWDDVTPLENNEALCDALDHECLGI